MKLLKIITINIITIFCLLFMLELYAALDSIQFFERYYNAIFETITPQEHLQILNNKNDNFFSFREDRNINSKKEPIIIMGCSFANGLFLDKKDVVSYKMSQLIDNPIYNRAYNGWGVKQMLYQLENRYIYQEIKKEPKYIIYFFISDHIARLQGHKFNPLDREFVPYYKEEKGKLIGQNPNILNKLIFSEYFYLLKGRKDQEDFKINKTNIYFNEAKKAMQRKWRNTKIVIAIYPRYYDNKTKMKEWMDIMRKNGFIVIDISALTDEDLTSLKYQINDRYHPNAEAWDVVLPPLLKELNLL